MCLNYKYLLDTHRSYHSGPLKGELPWIKHEVQLDDPCFRFSACTVAKANQNEALLWKIAVQRMKNFPVGDGTL
jgi:hypothetical protein